MTVYPETPDQVTEAEICAGEEFIFLGQTYTTTGTFEVTGVDANGCEFVQVLDLTVLGETPNEVTEAEICEGEVFTFQGQSYSTSGSFEIEASDANGCEFVQILELTVLPLDQGSTETASICAGDSFFWPVDGQTYTQGGTFTASTGGACPGVNTLVLTVTPLQQGSTETASICAGDSFFWPVDGQTYTQGGTFTASTGGACPGVNTLVLTVTPVQQGTTRLHQYAKVILSFGKVRY